MLAEFASAVDAVKSAVAIQRELKTRNAELEEHRRMEFRIGLNVGDVITDEGRLYGDGVNIAARLEGLSDPGGICISESVHMQVQNKLALAYEYIGEREVKNIARLVPVYKVQLEADGRMAPAASTVSQERPVHSLAEETGPSRRGPLAALAVVAVLLVAGGMLLFRPVSQQLPSPPETGVIGEAPVLPLPDKPSIAVLPFTNMSGDPEQDYFSDGLTEDLITDLSKFSGLFVIARHSVFTYKGQTQKVEQVGRELGVQYVVEGSVRKAGERVRITAQLVEAATGRHVWGERYDRAWTHIFTVQDEIVQQIGATLRVEVVEAEQARVRRIPTENLTAYDAWLRGREYWWRITKDDNIQARQLFERALELDPQYAEAYTGLGWTYVLEWVSWNQDPPLLERAGELAQHALALDDSLPDAHSLLGYVYVWHQQPEQAIAAGERALALDPNWARGYVWLAEILNHAGRRPAEAIRLVQQAMRLNPRYPSQYPYILGMAYYSTGQFAEAIAAFKEALRLDPNAALGSYYWLALSYLGQWNGQWSEDPQTLERAVEAAQQAVARSDSTFWVHGTLSSVYLWQKRHEEALVAAERGVALNATDALSHAYLGYVLNFAGRSEKALEKIEQVSCTTALGSGPPFCFSVLGEAYSLTRRYEEAIAAYKQALTHQPSWIMRLSSHLGLAASYSELGREEEARAEIAEVLKLNPQFSLEGIRQRWPYKDPADLARYVTALRQAGLE